MIRGLAANRPGHTWSCTTTANFRSEVLFRSSSIRPTIF